MCLIVLSKTQLKAIEKPFVLKLCLKAYLEASGVVARLDEIDTVCEVIESFLLLIEPDIDGLGIVEVLFVPTDDDLKNE